MGSLCLCMIVRDESAVIERCLASVRDLIDHWVICDTGSTDGTPELIERTLADVPGELHQREWRNFGHNRTELMELARGKADYLLLIDADMTVERRGDLPEDLTADVYMLKHTGSLEYRIARLVRGDRDWRFEGSTHEYLAMDDDTTREPLDALVINHFADGGTRDDKFERDIQLLLEELERDPDNGRAVFYLAQSYRDLGDRERACALYERRAEMGGWDEEVYYSLLQAGILRADLGQWPAGMNTLVRAWERRPQRLEALYELTWRLRDRGEYRTAHLFARRGLDRPPPADDILFVQPWVYQWALLFEYSITAYYAGEPRAAFDACERLLTMDLPDEHRQQTLVNRDWCLKKLAADGHRMKIAPPSAAERRARRLEANANA